ncbi:hypothetical protein B0D71_24565 [Pseudomonas laurylsulfativorans]|uniref:Uncharacterized protein n=1 Tax=Pseudomonas laurylsulfativorans TaxID=1943631 RepID=A0A2S3VIS8_9PSED|nr:hypothetical protein B0D71_24565 [Pseudomonas laurylsulfativorans]
MCLSLVSAWAWSLVGAGLSGRRIAAMVVNDNACKPDKRRALESIAGKPAPTSMVTPFSAILYLMRVWLAFIYPASEWGCRPAPR